MNITIIGKGNMGSALGKLAQQAGHRITFASTNPAQPVLPALEEAELVVLAVPYSAALALAENAEIAAKLVGKIVVDVTNPLTADFMGLTIGHTTSAGEEIAQRLPGARTVKAFNTLFAEVLVLQAGGAATQATVLVASDDEGAKNTVMDLARAFGFETVDAGALGNARYLEPMVEQLIQLAYGKGMGSKIGFALVQAG